MSWQKQMADEVGLAAVERLVMLLELKLPMQHLGVNVPAALALRIRKLRAALHKTTEDDWVNLAGEKQKDLQ